MCEFNGTPTSTILSSCTSGFPFLNLTREQTANKATRRIVTLGRRGLNNLFHGVERRLLWSVLLVSLVAASSLTIYVLATQPLIHSTPQHESLYLDHYAIESARNQNYPTLLTLWIGNSGNSPTTLSTASIRDLTVGGNTVSFSLGGQTLNPAVVNSVTVDTTSSGFYFTSTHSYTVSIVTARNSQFGFTVSYT